MSRIFIRNKYTKWYLSIVKQAKNRCIEENIYYEKHHILPSSLFKKYKNLKKYVWNGVFLTPKEHFIVHCLLTKMTKGLNRRKMLFALKCFKMNNEYQKQRYTSKIFDLFRKEICSAISENNKGRTRKLGPQSVDHKKNLNISRKKSEKFIKSSIKNGKKGSEKSRGIPRPEHLKKQWSERHKGKKFSLDHKINISISAKNRKIVDCPYCDKTGSYNIMKRWHFDNCKFKI